MKHFIFSCFLFGLSLVIQAQTDPLTQVHGARSQGMGNLRVFTRNSWSYFNNPGALAAIKESSLAVGYDSRFGMQELSTFDFSAALQTGSGTWGMGISRFGGSQFNQQSLGVAFGHQLGPASIGGKTEWFQTHIEGFGSGNSLIFSLGGLVELAPSVSLGASIFNLNRARLSSDSPYRLPTGLSLGLLYHPGKSLEMHLEIEKDIQLYPVYKVGLEYGIKEWLYLRTGINSNPGRVLFGLGVQKSKFSVDYAYGQNQHLGTTHHVNLGLKLHEK